MKQNLYLNDSSQAFFINKKSLIFLRNFFFFILETSLSLLSFFPALDEVGVT